jgi:hypothetical protein
VAVCFSLVVGCPLARCLACPLARCLAAALTGQAPWPAVRAVPQRQIRVHGAVAVGNVGVVGEVNKGRGCICRCAAVLNIH